jgi:hypothetical protein
VNPFPVRLLPALALLAALCAGEAGAKSLIEMGWDEPDPAFMRAHVAEMEAQPFDGTVYHVGGDRGGGARGLTGAFSWQVWGRRRWTEAELAGDVRDLQAIRWTRFRHNFLRINTTPGNVDWFDDYSPVLANLTLAASIARRAGSKGVLIDTESYGDSIFAYRKQRGRGRTSFARYSEQARKRGAEVMRALEAGYPGLTVFLTLGGTHADIIRRGDRVSYEKGYYGLLPAFVDGMVDGASASATIVDGLEGAFPVRTIAQVDHEFSAHDIYRARVRDPEKYGRTVSRSIAIWMDFDWRNRPWRTDDLRANYRSPEALRTVLARALAKADDYVWLYSEKAKWWTGRGGRENLPDAYVQAVRDARKGLIP